MGGYGSGRWAWARTRATTDGLLRLDVRRLARDGCLRPGRWDVAWRRGEEVLGRIAVIGRRDDPPEVTLEYRVRAGDGPWEPMRERIGLERTPCRYGGERPWFRCPGCGRRRAVLYSVGGRFRCRGCHDLAYGSTREGAGERDHRRADGLRSRLGAPAGTRVAMPEKPKHMRWRTYERIVEEIAEREGAAFAREVAERRAVVDRLERKYGPVPSSRPRRGGRSGADGARRGGNSTRVPAGS